MLVIALDLDSGRPSVVERSESITFRDQFAASRRLVNRHDRLARPGFALATGQLMRVRLRTASIGSEIALRSGPVTPSGAATAACVRSAARETDAHERRINRPNVLVTDDSLICRSLVCGDAGDS
jgi:hypothetical protein